MDYSKLTDDELASLPPELLQEVLAEIQAKNAKAQPEPPAKGEYSNVEISDKMHPSFGAWDRFVVKNFASSPDAGIGYLKKEYPDMQFLKTRDGEIVGKKQEDPYYYRLDEKGASLMDATDLVADVGQGAAEASVGTAAGIASANPYLGALAAGGIGFISEGVKQNIGSALGIPENSDLGNQVTSGVFSGVMPGVGAGLKSAWGATKNAAPKVMSKLSGFSEDVLRNINLDEKSRNLIAQMGPDKFASNVHSSLREGFKNAEVNSGKLIAATQNPTAIDIKSVKNKLTSDLANLPPEQMGFYSQAKDALLGAGDLVSPQDVFRYKNQLYKIGQSRSAPSLTKSSAATSSEMLRKSLEGNAINPAAFNEAMAKHTDLMKTQYSDGLRPLLKNDEKALDSLAGWYKGKKANDKALNEARKNLSSKVNNFTGVDLEKSARELESYKLFNDPSKWNSDGSVLHKYAPQIGAGLGYAIGSTTGAAPFMGALVGGAAGAGVNFATSPYVIKKAASMAPVLDNAGDQAARYIYQNPYMKVDKALLNIMQNENNR